MAKTHEDSAFFTDAEDFFASDQVVEKIVACPEMKPGRNGEIRTVIVRSMGGPEKVAFDAKRWDPSKPGGDPERFRAKWFEEERPALLVAQCCVRPDGTRLFTVSDANRLKGVNPKTFARLFAAAQEVNGDDVADLKMSGKAEAPIWGGDSGSESRMPTDIGQLVSS